MNSDQGKIIHDSWAEWITRSLKTKTASAHCALQRRQLRLLAISIYIRCSVHLVSLYMFYLAAHIAFFRDEMVSPFYISMSFPLSGIFRLHVKDSHSQHVVATSNTAFRSFTQHQVKPITYLTMKSNVPSRSFLTVACTRAIYSFSRSWLCCSRELRPWLRHWPPGNSERFSF